MQAAGHQKEAARLRGSLAAASTALDAVRSSRHGLLEAATLEQVELPRLEGDGDQQQQQQQQQQDGSDAMDVDEPAGSSGAAAAAPDSDASLAAGALSCLSVCLSAPPAG